MTSNGNSLAGTDIDPKWAQHVIVKSSAQCGVSLRHHPDSIPQLSDQAWFAECSIGKRENWRKRIVARATIQRADLGLIEAEAFARQCAACVWIACENASHVRRQTSLEMEVPTPLKVASGVERVLCLHAASSRTLVRGIRFEFRLYEGASVSGRLSVHLLGAEALTGLELARLVAWAVADFCGLSDSMEG